LTFLGYYVNFIIIVDDLSSAELKIQKGGDIMTTIELWGEISVLVLIHIQICNEMFILIRNFFGEE